MNGWNGLHELTGTMLKVVLNMKGLNQSLQTTQIKFDLNNGINLCDLVKLGPLENKGENAAYHDLLLFQQCFQMLFA